MSRTYHTSPSETLNALLTWEYPEFQYDKDRRNLIARNIIYQNPELSIKLMPPQFWIKPGLMISTDFEDVMLKQFGNLKHPLEIPEFNDLIKLRQPNYKVAYEIDTGSHVGRPYCFEKVFAETNANNFAFVLSHKILTEKLKEKAFEYTKEGGKLAGDTTKDMLEKAYELLKMDPEFLQSMGVADVTWKTFLKPENIQKTFTNENIKRFFSKLNAKIKIEEINGERFVTVYGNKDANGALKVLLEGTEKDAEIIALGIGGEAAKQLAKKIPYISIVIVSTVDIRQYILSDKETLEDLLTNLAVDNAGAIAMTAAATYLGAIAAGLITTGFLLPMVCFVGVVIVVGFLIEKGYEFLDHYFHITEKIKSLISKTLIHNFENFVEQKWSLGCESAYYKAKALSEMQNNPNLNINNGPLGGFR